MSPRDLPGNHSSLIGVEARQHISGLTAACRSWRFVPALDRCAQERALASEADVLVADMDELTPPRDRPAACIRAVDFMAECRQAGAVAAVRISALHLGGRQQLEKLMEGGPAAVLLSDATTVDALSEVAALLDACETRLGLPPGRTALVPVMASPLAIVRTFELLSCCPRIKASVLGGRQLARALRMPDAEDATTLRHVRSRYALECAAAGCLAVDSAHLYPDAQSFAEDLAWARAMGITSKCAATDDQVSVLNRAFASATQENRHADPA